MQGVKFIRYVRKPSIVVINQEDIWHMQNYQSELISLKLYEPKSPDVVMKINEEISRVEKWINKKSKEFVNDNNRTLNL